MHVLMPLVRGLRHFNNARIRWPSLLWYLSSLVLCKSWHSVQRVHKRELALLNSPLKCIVNNKVLFCSTWPHARIQAALSEGVQLTVFPPQIPLKAGHYRLTSETPFKRWLSGGQMVAQHWILAWYSFVYPDPRYPPLDPCMGRWFDG